MNLLSPLLNRFQLYSFSILLLSVSPFLMANSISADKDHSRQMARYFELSGINDLLESIPEQLKSMQLDAENEYGTDSLDNKIMQSLIDAWDDRKIKHALMTKINDSITSQQLSALIQWQSSALPQLVKHKEAEANNDDFEQKFVQFVRGIPENMPDRNHRAAINKVIDAKHMVDNMIDLTLSVSRPVLLALVETESARKEKMTVSDVERQLFELEHLLQDDLSHQISILSYFLYKNLSTTELNEYAQFYQSDLGLVELSLLNEALHYSIALWQTAYAGRSPHLLLTKRTPNQ
ncbi:hypothetical protein [Thalassotalea atypica]|uniref:hypothetical protein n=1 Tax=Thalassotalea atypica TaxID=2054316 RepID=UPI0025741BFF|nr:hypothetical protein [Thalassotalea atypica]